MKYRRTDSLARERVRDVIDLAPARRRRDVIASVLEPMPVAFVDVDYAADDSTARAACVVARAWSDAHADEEHVVDVGGVAPYRPGYFYERELPCIVAVLARVRARPRVVVVDGYVTLDADGRPGLGARLYERLGSAVAVVGVAKRPFRGSPMAIEVRRGDSARPLYVTARGIDAAEAARLVATMHGAHRIPTLLGRVDRLARGLETPLASAREDPADSAAPAPPPSAAPPHDGKK